ncbi:AAA family ATPase [Candidatus Phytoplasma rubi]|uniref:AAA family ATPase n=1 Tax=Candidatus Phytoplasma rubi TaxID=399025 RepID=A0ABY7BRA7_9MOLU|nr:SbcC/MukB-like Walker B domain-containing protein [Candidatus Phytoplasma rubi]WAN63240.1 AAA family ATPase [Candidatus Phytoplasma rubi]
MKKLTRIKLINWHLFSYQDIEIKDNILISGENGSGKSTLLDALQYVLIGERNGVKFNIAANENAKRSLESYIKGKIGLENKEFLRNNDVITHIALEFYDEIQKEYTILGCVLELPYRGLLKEKFYLFPNINLKKDIFIFDNNQIRNIKDMREYLRTFNKDFNFFDTKKQYQNAVGKYLQINIYKYLKILPKALAFKALNLQKFIFDFLLEENPINIKGLKNNVRQLKKIESQIEIEKIKLKELAKIIEIHKNLKKIDVQVKIYFLTEKMVLVKKNEKKLENAIKTKELINQELSKLLLNKKKYNESIEYLNDYILKLQTNKIQNNLGSIFYSLQKDLANDRRVVQEIQEKIDILKKQLAEEIVILENLFSLNQDNFLKESIQKINSFLQNSRQQKTFILKEDVVEISNYLFQKIINININQNILNKEIILLKEKINKNNYELEMINQNFVSQNDHFVKINNLLKEKLKNKYNKNIFVYPLCELIEIKDELWRNAIEGFLGSRKFNLIIDYRYFDSALKIYEKLQDDLKIYDVGLVNTEKITDIPNNLDSLASHIFSDNKDALKYAKILLSYIKCELNIENLKNHKTAITPSGMIYSNYSAKKLNPKIYKIPYIGLNSFKIRKDIILNELILQTEELLKKQNYFRDNENIIFLIKKSKISSIVNWDFSSFFQQQKEKEENIINIEEKITQLQLNHDLTKLEDNIFKSQEEKKIKTKKLEQILLEIAEYQNKEKINILQINNLEKELIFYKEQLFEEEKKEILNIEAASVQIHNYLNEYPNNYEMISKSIQENLKSIEKQQNILNTDLIFSMKTYIDNYNLLNIESNIESFDFFVKEYNLISSKNLVKYEQEAKELTIKTEIIFKEEFINKLTKSIIEAQQQIQNLNQILKNRPFGEDYYQIIFKPSDEPEYQKYYSFFIQENKLDQTNLFYENNLSYKDIVLNELFQKIMSFEQEYENISYQFLDYRNYLNYDIKIYDKDGNFSFFSKIFREKSGGETQVPFYIIIAICFEQLLSETSEYKGCLVFFDEAFNNMDENRIDAMMSFFNSLKIQFFIAIPPQRIANILPHVKTNLIVVKDKNYAIVESFTKEI